MKKVLTIFNFVWIILLFSACTIIPSSEEVRRAVFMFTMDTSIEGYIYVENARFNEVSQGIKQIFDDYEALTDNFRSHGDVHGVYYINEQTEQSDISATVEVDKKLYDLIEFGLEITEDTDGYFNMTMGKIIDVWKEMMAAYDLGEIVPQDVIDATIQLAAAIPIIEDPIELSIVEDKYYITMKKGAKLDLGALAKGYAIEKSRAYFDEQGITKYFISGGSSSVIVGIDNPNRASGDYNIGLTNPLNPSPNDFYGIFAIQNQNITTSGSYRQYVRDADNNWYHHIISPITKMPAQNFYTVTLVGDDAGLLDGYSTALFCMTIEQIEAFLADKDIEGVSFNIDGSISHYNLSDRYIDRG